MEKRTIGKFIAILRKANGMTQKELGDRLYVSDKTVSRWENDESLPELNLIPSLPRSSELRRMNCSVVRETAAPVKMKQRKARK